MWPTGARGHTLFAVARLTNKDSEALRVLGVDPAAAGSTGYGVVESDGRRCRMLRFGALRASRKGPEGFSERLCEIHSTVSGLIDEFQPHGVAIESVFTALNVKTALRLAEVRGVVLLAAAQRNVPACSYSPREVKASVAGYGNAGKEQMQSMVRALLGMTETPEPPDAADALAVALCHVQATQFRLRMGNGIAQGVSLQSPVSSLSNSRSRNSNSRISLSR